MNRGGKRSSRTRAKAGRFTRRTNHHVALEWRKSFEKFARENSSRLDDKWRRTRFDLIRREDLSKSFSLLQGFLRYRWEKLIIFVWFYASARCFSARKIREIVQWIITKEQTTIPRSGWAPDSFRLNSIRRQQKFQGFLSSKAEKFSRLKFTASTQSRRLLVDSFSQETSTILDTRNFSSLRLMHRKRAHSWVKRISFSVSFAWTGSVSSGGGSRLDKWNT